MKRYLKIKQRAAEIEAMLNAEDITAENVEELSMELSGLIDERKALEAQDATIRSRVAELTTKTNVPAEPKLKEGDLEQRAKALHETGRVTLPKNIKQLRATTIASGQIAQPTSVSGINDMFPTVSSLVDLVTIEDAAGMGAHLEAYEKGDLTGEFTAEGADYHESDPEFGYAEFKPSKITVYTEVTKEVQKLTPLAYLAKIESKVIPALKKRLATAVIVGDPAATPAQNTGIYNAPALEEAPLEITQIDEFTLRRIVLNYGGDVSVFGPATLILNKLDLIAFGEIRSELTKQPVYTISPDTNNPNTGTISDAGATSRYIIEPNVPALSAETTAVGENTMIYGNLAAYTIKLFSDYEVEVSQDFKFRQGMLAIRADVMVGGNVTFYNGFTIIAKGATVTP